MRRQGTGTIEFRRGRYWVRLGPKRKRYGPFDTKEQAETQADALLAESLPTIPISGATVYQYGLTVLARRRKQGRANADSDESKWRVHVMPSLLGQTPIDAVEPYHVTELVNELLTKNASPGRKHRIQPRRKLSRSTVLQTVSLVRIVLGDARRVGPQPSLVNRDTIG